jgi:hypothetical protein
MCLYVEASRALSLPMPVDAAGSDREFVRSTALEPAVERDTDALFFQLWSDDSMQFVTNQQSTRIQVIRAVRGQ